MAMAEEAMVPAAAEVAALRLAAEVAEAATAKGRRNETKLARAKRRRVSEAEGKRRRAQPDACLCARLARGERAWTARARPPRGRARRARRAVGKTADYSSMATGLLASTTRSGIPG